jgi:hypothetical protein
MVGRVGGDKSGELGGRGTGEVIFQLFIFLKLYFLNFYSIFKINPLHPPFPPHYLSYDKIYIYNYTKSIRNGKRENGGGRWGGSRFCGGVGFGRLGEVSLQLLCTDWDVKHICRLFLIFRYLLRPEMMVIYT